MAAEQSIQPGLGAILAASTNRQPAHPLKSQPESSQGFSQLLGDEIGKQASFDDLSAEVESKTPVREAEVQLEQPSEDPIIANAELAALVMEPADQPTASLVSAESSEVVTVPLVPPENFPTAANDAVADLVRPEQAVLVGSEPVQSSRGVVANLTEVSQPGAPVTIDGPQGQVNSPNSLLVESSVIMAPEELIPVAEQTTIRMPMADGAADILGGPGRTLRLSEQSLVGVLSSVAGDAQPLNASGPIENNPPLITAAQLHRAATPTEHTLQRDMPQTSTAVLAVESVEQSASVMESRLEAAPSPRIDVSMPNAMPVAGASAMHGVTNVTPANPGPSPVISLDLSANNWSDEFAKEVFNVRELGDNRIRINVAPAGLGNIDCEIIDTAKGLELRLVTETTAARDLIQESGAALRERFQEAGMNLSAFDCRSGSSGSHAQGAKSDDRGGGASQNAETTDTRDDNLTNSRKSSTSSDSLISVYA